MDITYTWISQFPFAQTNSIVINSKQPTCFVKNYTIEKHFKIWIQQEKLITLTMFRTQASHDEPANKGFIYDFEYKGVYLRANIEVLPHWMCEVIVLQVSQCATYIYNNYHSLLQNLFNCLTILASALAFHVGRAPTWKVVLKITCFKEVILILVSEDYLDVTWIVRASLKIPFISYFKFFGECKNHYTKRAYMGFL